MNDFLKKISLETGGRRRIGSDIIPKAKSTAARPPRSDERITVIPIRRIQKVEKSIRPEFKKGSAKFAEVKPLRATSGGGSSAPFRSLRGAPLVQHETGASSFERPAAVSAVRRSRRFFVRFAVAGTVIFAGGAGILLTTVFSRLTIFVTPVVVEKEITPLAVTADTKVLSVDSAGRRIPGLKVTVERTYQGRYAATGKKYIETYAAGRVTIFNALSSVPQVLIKNTRFADPGGTIFRLTKNITVPGAKVEDGKIVPSSIEADVVADKTGEAFNIGPSDFTIPGFQGTPKYTAFTAKSNAAFSGGFQGESVVATADDIRQGQEQATRELFAELKKDLEGKIPQGSEFVVLDGARNILITDVEGARAGDRGDTFALEARGVAEVLIVKKADVIALLTDSFLPHDFSTVVAEGRSDVRYSNVRLDASNGKLSFTVGGKIVASRVVSEEEIRTAVVSRPVADLEQLLDARQDVRAFRIRVFPSWLWKAPSRSDSVRIQVEEPEKKAVE